MKKTKINLDSNLLKEIDLSRLNVKQKFNLDVSNAIHLLSQKF